EIVTAALRHANGDPRYASLLESLVNNPVFNDLATMTPDGRSEALKLMRANLSNPAAPAVTMALVQSMILLQTPKAKLQALQALQSGSPLNTDQIRESMGLLASVGALTPGDQELVTEGLKGARANATYAEKLRSLITDQKFFKLKPD